MKTNNLPERLRSAANYLACIMRLIVPEGYETVEVKTIRHAADEIERLRAIIDKLPKCWRLNEQGELVQDESILSGMNVVTICKTNAGGVAKNITEEVGVVSVEACEGGGFDIVIRDGDGNEWYLKEEELYLTREAAEAAREE